MLKQTEEEMIFLNEIRKTFTNFYTKNLLLHNVHTLNELF